MSLIHKGMHKFILIVLLLTLSRLGYSQGSDYNFDENASFKERIRVGGDFALNFGTITYINFAPRIGYLVKPKLLMGFGASYSYLQDERFDLEFTNYGALVFGQYQILENVILQSEYHQLSALTYSQFTGERIRVPVEILFVGGSYRLELGNYSFGYVSIMYDVIGDINSPYQNPYFGGGLMFGF